MADAASIWNGIFISEFSKESDRAAVILTASLLDNALDNLLKNFLVPVATSDDELFDGPNAPFSALSSKINIAYRLGLISSDFSRDLHLIRKLRNDFAHNIQGCDFKQPQIHQRVSQLCNSSKMIEKTPNLRRNFPEGIRGDFLMVASWMLFHLNGWSERITPIVSRQREHHYSKILSDIPGKTLESAKEENSTV